MMSGQSGLFLGSHRKKEAQRHLVRLQSFQFMRDDVFGRFANSVRCRNGEKRSKVLLEGIITM